MEHHPSYVAVLDNEGRAIEAANMGYQEGQVVREIIVRQTPKTPILFHLAPPVAVVCLCLAVLGGGAYGAYGMPYGTAETRINPDVRMSMSYADCVVGLKGVNEDGKKLIDQIPCKRRNSERMTGILTERVMEVGYLTEGGTIYVTASGGSERQKAKQADTIHTELDTLLKDGMPVEVHAGSIGEDGLPAVTPHHEGEIPRGTGKDKLAFIGMPSGGMREDADGNGEDDRDEDERGDDTESDDEENDVDPDKYDKGDGDDREGDAGKDKAGDKDGDRDNDGKDDTDDKGDNIKKARDKSDRNNVVRQNSSVDDDKDLDNLDERNNGRVRNGLNDNRDRDEDDSGRYSDQNNSDKGGSDKDDIDKNDSQEEDSDGYGDGEDDKGGDKDDDD